jgi:hypothetical protein
MLSSLWMPFMCVYNRTMKQCSWAAVAINRGISNIRSQIMNFGVAENEICRPQKTEIPDWAYI